MKRLLCAVLGAALIALTACSGGGTESTQASTRDSVVQTEAPARAPRDPDAVYEYETREIWCENNGNRIYGVAYIPKIEGVSRFPLVIHSHGMGSNHEAGAGYCKRYAEKGFAGYTFDFPGGSKPSVKNRSDGDPMEMSPMTEAADLQAILDTALTWDFVDTDCVFLEGGSQGGLVSTLIGIENSDKIHGLILHYPSLYQPQIVSGWYDSPESVPDTLYISDDYTLGGKFARDLFGVDVASRLGEFDGNVVIIHGSEDPIVDPSSIEEASHRFKHCDFYLIEGAGHGFSGEDFKKSVQYGLDFLFANT